MQVLAIKSSFGRGLCGAAIFAVVALVGVGQAQAEPALRRAFVTNGEGTGNLGTWAPGLSTGLDAGDAICQAAATFEGFPGPENYRAWLSTPTTDAYCHVRGQTGKRGSCSGGDPLEAGPWYLANGITPFTGPLDAILGLQAEIYFPALLYQDFSLVTEHDTYWTGTDSDGTVATAHCNSWTDGTTSFFGQVGDALATTLYWTDRKNVFCKERKSLLCLETGESIALGNPWLPGSLGFVTSTHGSGKLATWDDAGGQIGIAAGDAICRAHARRGGLPDPDSFFAWLSDGSTHAGDRLTSPGQYRRVDHRTIDTGPAAMIDGGTRNSIHVDEMGRYLSFPRDVWTGTLGDGQASGFDCNDWTDATGGFAGRYGSPAYARSDRWTDFGYVGCDGSKALYCFSNEVAISWDGFESGDTSAWTDTSPAP